MYLNMGIQSFLCWIIVLVLTVYGLSRIIRSTWQFCRAWIAASSFPGPPKSSWLSGHLSYMTLGEDDMKHRMTFSRHGKLINWQMGSSNIVMATHPESAKLILQRPDPKDMPAWHVTKDWLGEGLLTSQGDKWHRNRKLITPAFHFSVLRTYVPSFQRCFEKLVTQWSVESQGGQSVNVYSGMKFTTLECLLNCAFGEDGLTEIEKRRMLEALENVMYLWGERERYFWYHFDWIYRLSADGRSMAASLKTVHGNCLRVIENCRNAGFRQPSPDNDAHMPTFIEILLNARDEEGVGLSTKEILDEVNTFVFAGHDTTGNAIPFCLHFLAKYPDFQDACRQEIYDVIGDKADITWEDLAEMKYNTMFIKESLRLCGPLSFIFRTAGCEIPLTNAQTIPEGCPIGAMVDSVHYNPDVWESPEVFNPLRFSPERADKRHPYAFLAFSAGPRHCMGQPFAMAEIKVVMITVLRKFRLSLDEDKPLKVSFKTLLRGTEDGMWIKMERL